MGGHYEEQNRGGNDVIQTTSVTMNARSRNHTKMAGLQQRTNMAYRKEIMATRMTYQLVPPDDHRRNTAKNKSKHGKTTSLQYAAVSPLTSKCTYGAGSSHKKKNSGYYSDNQISTQTFQLSLTSTDLITITLNHLSPLARKP